MLQHAMNTGWMNLSFHSHWFFTSESLNRDDYLMYTMGGDMQ